MIFSIFNDPDLDNPVMEKHHIMKQALESLFGSMDLNSWTIHETKIGTTFTLRFRSVDHKAGDSNTNIVPNAVSFKKKSPYQVNRDRQRLDQFRRQTRSQTNSQEHSNIENSRHGDIQSMQLSANVLSPVSVSDSGSSPYTSPLQAAESPCTSLPSRLTGSPLLAEPEEVIPAESIDMPASISEDEFDDSNADNDVGYTVEDPVKPQKSQNPKTRYLSNLPRSLETDLFRQHVINVNASWNTMHCDDCGINVNKAINNPLNSRMSYCNNCNLYFCENCLEKEHICYCKSSPEFIT